MNEFAILATSVGELEILLSFCVNYDVSTSHYLITSCIPDMMQHIASKNYIYIRIKNKTFTYGNIKLLGIKLPSNLDTIIVSYIPSYINPYVNVPLYNFNVFYKRALLYLKDSNKLEDFQFTLYNFRKTNRLLIRSTQNN